MCLMTRHAQYPASNRNPGDHKTSRWLAPALAVSIVAGGTAAGAVIDHKVHATQQRLAQEELREPVDAQLRLQGGMVFRAFQRDDGHALVTEKVMERGRNGQPTEVAITDSRVTGWGRTALMGVDKNGQPDPKQTNAIVTWWAQAPKVPGYPPAASNYFVFSNELGAKFVKGTLDTGSVPTAPGFNAAEVEVVPQLSGLDATSGTNAAYPIDGHSASEDLAGIERDYDHFGRNNPAAVVPPSGE